MRSILAFNDASEFGGFREVNEGGRRYRVSRHVSRGRRGIHEEIYKTESRIFFCWPRLNLDRSGIFTSLFPREPLLFSRYVKEIFFYPSTKEENTRSTIVAISWNIFISTFGRYRYRRAKMQKASMRVNSLLNASSLFVYEFIYSLREYLALYIRSRSRGEKEFVESRNYMGSRIKREILRGWSVAHARLKRIS